MTTKPDPAPAAPAQPVGTPPGGGRWTWDAQAAQWVSLPDTADIEIPFAPAMDNTQDKE
jgi:hypothetical protein